jgi:hypothetical protein
MHFLTHVTRELVNLRSTAALLMLLTVLRIRWSSSPGTHCIVLRGQGFNVIDLNVHAPSEEKSDDSKDSFYEELERVF